MKIILASASPRRRELLEQIGLAFEIRVSDVEEKVTTSDPGQVVEELSRQKAEAVLTALEEKEEDVLVIGADTVVALEGHILGKPADQKDAVGMLKGLSGRSHEVYTGVTLLYRPRSGGGDDAMAGEAKDSAYEAMPGKQEADEVFSVNRKCPAAGESCRGSARSIGSGDAGSRVCRKTFHERTKVAFYPLTEGEISDYVSSGECLDKAGAYGIQGIFARYVQGIEGDYNNVVGLPVGRLYQEAKEWLRG